MSYWATFLIFTDTQANTVIHTHTGIQTSIKIIGQTFILIQQKVVMMFFGLLYFLIKTLVILIIDVKSVNTHKFSFSQLKFTTTVTNTTGIRFKSE